jgi:DNA polymerase-3 subunit gamma/tau
MEWLFSGRKVGMVCEDEVMAADSETPRQSLALYRKYRPATFAEVRGQEHVTEPLRQALRSGRINHAYLFSGPRGCGKTSSARILARSLNCVNGPTPDPCGVCDSCVALAPSGPGSIDVIEIDAASHGGVDDARDLRERAFYAPVSGRFKIYIIDEAHMVTQQGFNALLKLVEEPPPHLKFIFATTEPEKVIPTIRSRTHHYPFRLMAPSVMRDLADEILAAEHVPFDPAVLPLVVRAGGGSARDTLSILDQLLAGSDADGIKYDRAVALLGYTDASLLDEMVEAFAAADGAAVFRAVNRVIEGGHEPRRFATDMLDRFRDLIVLASVPDAISSGLLDVPPDRADALKSQAEGYGLASLTRAADIVAAGLDQMRGATSPRLLLELMCAQVLLPAATADDRSLLARIERLESGAPARVPAGTTESYPERVRPAPKPAPSSEVGAAPSASQPSAAPRQEIRPNAEAAQHQVPGPAAEPAPRSEPAQRQAPVPPAAAAPPPAAPFTHAPGAPGAPAPGASGAPRGGSVTVEALRQAWPSVVDAIKAKGRVAAIVIGNASVASFDEGVLTLRFPRQGDVKGFQGSKYEDLLKQALTAMFGINVVVRATSGGDTPPAARRPGPGPAAPSGPAPGGQPPAPGQASWGQPAPGQQGPGQPGPGQPPAGAPPEDPAAPAAAPSPGGYAPRADDAVTAAWQTGGKAVNGDGAGTTPFGGPVYGGTGDLPPLPPPPSPDDEDFDPDDDDYATSTTVNELTGMALVQRELGAEIIAEYED